MKVTFWGTRGSIPRSRQDMIRYGGNTACVQVTSRSGAVMALDMGSGAFDLGQELIRTGTAGKGAVLVSHTHWDHIQGFPFFAPLFTQGSRWDIYGPRGLGNSLRETLAGQMQYTYFPISLDQMAAEVRYHDLVEGSFEVKDFSLRAQYLNHPALTLGYRLQSDGVVVVYAPDHEPFDPRYGVEGFKRTGGEGDRHLAFVTGADLLIHDAQYTAEEYPGKKGWGHSTIEYVVDLALVGDVRRLALFHHDPLRDDHAMDRLVDRARQRVRAAGGTLEVFAAADFTSVELVAAPGAVPVPAAAGAAAHFTPALQDRAVLVALRDSPAAVTIAQGIQRDDLRVLVAHSAEEVMTMARAEHPSLLLLDQNLPGGGALEICVRIRGEGEWGRDVPVAVVAARRSASDVQAGERAGVTGWLIEPFSSAFIRTRIRAWLLRAACRWQNAPIPDDEPARLAALHAVGLLDTPAEERFDRITRRAAEVFGVPIALVSLVDENRQWFKSHHGLAAVETPRDEAFCAHAIHHDDVMLVPDALQDERFAENPLVVGEPRVRFYAGCPLVLANGNRIGTLCLIDHRARDLNEKEVQQLRDLARMVECEIAAETAKSTAPG